MKSSEKIKIMVNQLAKTKKLNPQEVFQMYLY